MNSTQIAGSVGFDVYDDRPRPDSMRIITEPVDLSRPSAIRVSAVPVSSSSHAAGSGGAAPFNVPQQPPSKRDKIYICKMNNSVAIPIEAKDDKEEADIQDFFAAITQETFQILIDNGTLECNANFDDFKLFVTKDRVGTWEYHEAGNEQNGRIDYCPECEANPNLKGLFDVFDKLLMDPEQAPLGLYRFPSYVPGCMADINQPNGFHILPRETRSALPGNAGGFITDHFGRAMSGKTKEEHYDAMEAIMIRDRRKKRLESIVKGKITELQGINTTGFSPVRLREHQHNLGGLKNFSDRLQESDEFAANFALCHVGEDLDEVADAAEVHLRATPGALAPDNWSTYFMGGKKELYPDDKEYCKLVGTLVGDDRLAYHDHCNKHDIRCGNTVMEAVTDHFLPVLNKLVSPDVYTEIEGALGEEDDGDIIVQGMATIVDRNDAGAVTDVLGMIGNCKRAYNWETFVPAPPLLLPPSPARSRASSTDSSVL